MTLVLDPPEDLIESFSTPPKCAHGPTLLFREGNSSTSYYYYSCSASRDHDFCPFRLSAQKWKKLYLTEKGNFPTKKQNSETIQYDYLLDNVKAKLKYCLDCCRVLISSDFEDLPLGISPNHLESNHLRCKNRLNSSDLVKSLQRPSHCLKPQTKNKNFAQYFFSLETIRFVKENVVQRFHFQKILCLGCPSIHEEILIENDPKLSSLLLDLDPRYRQFYDKNRFIQFNMFNSYFFEPSDKNYLRSFLKNHSNNSINKILILIDPPFGGLIECLARSLKKLQWEFLKDFQVSILLFFPYFNEHWIRKTFGKTVKITNFIVTYENHMKYGKRKGSDLKSPVRIFTNLNLGNFIRFNPRLYRWCQKCSKTVFHQNLHCNQCQQCPGRDATKPLRHCQHCNRCVKITSKHCPKCQRCHITNKNCLR